MAPKTTPAIAPSESTGTCAIAVGVCVGMLGIKNVVGSGAAEFMLELVSSANPSIGCA